MLTCKEHIQDHKKLLTKIVNIHPYASQKVPQEDLMLQKFKDQLKVRERKTKINVTNLSDEITGKEYLEKNVLFIFFCLVCCYCFLATKFVIYL